MNEPEQKRRGNPAKLFRPDCLVVSADLYNALVYAYNKLAQKKNKEESNVEHIPKVG